MGVLSKEEETMKKFIARVTVVATVVVTTVAIAGAAIADSSWPY